MLQFGHQDMPERKYPVFHNPNAALQRVLYGSLRVFLCQRYHYMPRFDPFELRQRPLRHVLFIDIQDLHWWHIMRERFCRSLQWRLYPLRQRLR